MTQKNEKSKNIKQLMAEADELRRQINADAVKNMKDEHRLQFQKYTENLERIKFEFESETEKKETSEPNSGAEGMHEAIQDIVRAFTQLKTYLEGPIK